MNQSGAFRNAAFFGNVPALKAFVAFGVPCEPSGPDGYTPLHDAVSQAQAGAAQVLLEAGVSPLRKLAGTGASALDLAVEPDEATGECG